MTVSRNGTLPTIQLWEPTIPTTGAGIASKKAHSARGAILFILSVTEAITTMDWAGCADLRRLLARKVRVAAVAAPIPSTSPTSANTTHSVGYSIGARASA